MRPWFADQVLQGLDAKTSGCLIHPEPTKLIGILLTVWLMFRAVLLFLALVSSVIAAVAILFKMYAICMQPRIITGYVKQH